MQHGPSDYLLASVIAKPVPSYPYREAFELSHDPHLWFDAQTGRITDVNEISIAVLGYDATELIGANICILASASDLAASGSGWHTISCGSKIGRSPISVLGKSGVVIKMYASTFSRFDGNDNDNGCNSDDNKGGVNAGKVCDLLVLNKSAALEILEIGMKPPWVLDTAAHALAYEVAAIEARERQKIANDLHDEIGQLLAIMELKLGALGTSTSPDQLSSHIKELLCFVGQASQATRSATFELSCPLLQYLGLQAAIEGLAHRLTGISGLMIHIEGSLPKAELPHPVAQVLFRVVRELLMNVLKHARAYDVWVVMSGNDSEIQFLIVDNGVGMSGRQRRQFGPDGGYGLVSAEAQMRAMNGRLVFSSPDIGKNGGTRVELSVPIAPNLLPVDGGKKRRNTKKRMRSYTETVMSG